MFDELRKKLSNAVKSFIKREEKKEPEPQQPTQEKPAEEEQQEVKIESKETGPQQEEETEEKVEEPEEKKIEVPIKKTGEAPKQKKEEIIKLSLTTKIKSAFLGTIRLSEPEINNFLEILKVSMLESDVSYSTTEQFIEDLHSKLKEKQINSKKVREEITNTVRGSLFSVLYRGNAVNIDELLVKRKESGELPVKVLFLGPNGAGKTTTIAKIAHRFKSGGSNVVLSASDTFRAAAIEQIEHHAKKIGVPVIKSTYGADPASIAFDAIAYAKAHNMDVVLIDSAGRQETNKSLINEMQKMVRVSKPDITIFVGESTYGEPDFRADKGVPQVRQNRWDNTNKIGCGCKGWRGTFNIPYYRHTDLIFRGGRRIRCNNSLQSQLHS